MLDNAHSLGAFAPELVLGGLVVALIVVDLIAGRLRAGWCAALTVGACAIAAWATLHTAGEARGLFHGLVARDAFADFWKLFALVTCALVAVIAARSEENAAELYALVVTTTLGVMLMAAATDLLMAYLSLETVSVMSYLLAGFRRGARASAEAALKYVIYGGVASGVMLYGLSLLYGLAGATSFDAVLHAAATTPSAMTVLLAVVLSLAGFGYKIAAVPFHQWCPDVYEGAPTAVTAFFSVAPKAGGFALLLRFTLGLLPGELGGTTAPWTLLFALMAAASMTLGNLSAMPQTSVKRLLAYSSIAHAGYALLGVAAGGSDGTRAVLVYFATYLPMSLGAFVVVMAVEAAVGDTLDGWRGLGKRAPFAAAAMAIFLFSLTGLPPFAGFFGKFYVFAALLARGGGLMLTLAVIGVVNSAASLYFYARVLKAMYLEPAGDAAPLRVDPLHRAILAILALPTLGLFAIWSELAGLVDASLSRW